MFLFIEERKYSVHTGLEKGLSAMQNSLCADGSFMAGSLASPQGGLHTKTLLCRQGAGACFLLPYVQSMLFSLQFNTS